MPYPVLRRPGMPPLPPPTSNSNHTHMTTQPQRSPDEPRHQAIHQLQQEVIY